MIYCNPLFFGTQEVCYFQILSGDEKIVKLLDDNGNNLWTLAAEKSLSRVLDFLVNKLINWKMSDVGNILQFETQHREMFCLKIIYQAKKDLNNNDYYLHESPLPRFRSEFYQRFLLLNEHLETIDLLGKYLLIH